LERTPVPDIRPEASLRRLTDYQRFHKQLDIEKGFSTDLLFNFMLLQAEIGELAKVLKRWMPQPEAENFAKDRVREERDDVLAYVLNIANYTGIDLESAYLQKMAINRQRDWEKEGSQRT